jgi:zinc protease
LSNGVEVVLAERHAVPVVEMSIQFDAGYAADAGRKLGVASFAMSMLDTGTRERSALEIAAEAERLGANLMAGSNLDASSVNLSAIKTELAPSVDLWADVTLNPVFADEEIERLRGRWIANIAQEKAEPLALALRLLPPAIYGPGHAYGVPFTGSGTEESIASITRDDLVAFKDTWLRPDNARIFVVGDVTLAEMTPLLERAFRGWEAPNTPQPTKNVAEVELSAAPRVILIDKPNSPQSFILAGHVAPGLGSERDLAIEAMNDVLGGTFTARVNMNLREDKGWAYGAQTVLQSARGPRPFLVYAPVQTDRTGDSLAELVRELESITTTRPVGADEMSRVIAGSTRELPGQFQTAGAVLTSLITSVRYGRPLDYAATLTERYEALRLPDLNGAATDIVHPRSLIWVIVGDLDEIRPQVEALGLAPIEIWNDDGEPVT